MRLWPVKKQAANVGTLVITYNADRAGPNNIDLVRETDYQRLVNVIAAYQRLVDLRGQQATYSNEQVRHGVRERLGLRQSGPQPMPRQAFPLQTYVAQPGRLGRPERLTLGRVVALSPWLMRSAQLVDRRLTRPADEYAR